MLFIMVTGLVAVINQQISNCPPSLLHPGKTNCPLDRSPPLVLMEVISRKTHSSTRLWGREPRVNAALPIPPNFNITQATCDGEALIIIISWGDLPRSSCKHVENTDVPPNGHVCVRIRYVRCVCLPGPCDRNVKTTFAAEHRIKQLKDEIN